MMPWGVFEFPWGTAVRNMDTGEWTQVFKVPDGEMLVVEGLDVTVNEEGVHFNT